MVRNIMNDQGLLYCACYSVAPNFFGYCGGSENATLVDYLREERLEKDIRHIFSHFDTLVAYLKLISHENKIDDPFEKKVVEAYWIGNKLLKNISNLDYFYLLKEKLNIEKKLDANSFIKTKKKVMSLPFLPHHSFHVFNIFRRTGNDTSFHTIKTMDECRIGWGTIKGIRNYELGIKNFLVETKPLTIEDGKLKFGKPMIKKITTNYKGKVFLKNLKIGDTISFHWGFACEVLNDRQVKNLEYYTQRSIDYFNYAID